MISLCIWEMAMQRSDRGFFLLDSLLSIFIVSVICILCFTIYNLIEKYEEGYFSYQETSNERIESILNSLEECEGCLEDEYD